MSSSPLSSRLKAKVLLEDASLKGVLPPGFMYGCASASYQIEGGFDSDGKGRGIWDETLKDQDNGEVACDSYHLWKEDIKLVKQYGCNTYRFSISWPRVIPLGGKNDPVNEAGIKYYSDLIDECLRQGLTPFVTIFHWDYPLALEDRYGGFYDCDKIVPDFARFASLCFERFGDRVKHWITINEPHIFTWLSSMSYKRSTWKHLADHARFAKSLLLCHAKTVDVYRRQYQPTQKATIGIVFNNDWVEPLDDSKEAISAANFARVWVLGFYADPIFKGEFPALVAKHLGDFLPSFTNDEWALIKGSSDFFGWNHYGTNYATGKRVDSDDHRIVSFGSIEKVAEKDGQPIGNKGQGGHPYDVPWGCRKLVKYINVTYAKPASIPIYVTECGFAVENEADMDLKSRVDDGQRQDYFAGYLKELSEAVRDDGVNLGGFMVWSLLDNLEWLAGYRPRFGITAVERDDGCRRVPKDSSRLLKAIFEHIMTT